LYYKRRNIRKVYTGDINTIGETLRRERERQGLDLQKLSESTKIGTRMLRAMEAGDLSKLPGGVFTRSFFRQYAAALGLDPAYVEAEIRQLQPESPVATAQVESHFNPFESSEPGSNSLTAAAVWVLLALVGCGGVYYFARNYQFGSSPSAATGQAAAKPAEPGTARSDPAPPSSEPSSSKPVPAPPPSTIGSGSLQVVLNASEKSWVSVSVDGKLLFSGILQPNDRREINAEEKVKVVAGNAGGVDISLNGKNLEALGPRGQVRTVELTRAGAQVVSRTPKPAPLL
jgi:cytoskeleton protein RodZ